ncbi:MAG: type II toxin-antitoxin system PemK/MazF family toxin [Oscillospiraceae bacterium]|nr:type II toxin-antitoxin system PemK/MazF family toxin [Oscillospiraceae bacterium]
MIFSQGDIVKFNFDPTLGHEQAGYRPALVLSRDLFNGNTKQIVVCPITSKTKRLPMRIALDERTATAGYIMCDQIRTIDIIARKPSFVEKIPGDLLELALETVTAVFQMPQPRE